MFINNQTLKVTCYQETGIHLNLQDVPDLILSNRNQIFNPMEIVFGFSCAVFLINPAASTPHLIAGTFLEDNELTLLSLTRIKKALTQGNSDEEHDDDENSEDDRGDLDDEDNDQEGELGEEDGNSRMDEDEELEEDEENDEYIEEEGTDEDEDADLDADESEYDEDDFDEEDEDLDWEDDESDDDDS
jgi:hypothetical protein